MKQRLHLLAMLFVAATMTLGLAGCQPDEPEQPVQEEPQTLNLVGSSWESTVQSTATQQVQGGTIEMNVTLNAVIDILDGENADLFMDIAVEVPAYPAANQSMSQDESCTYTFDGTSLVLTSKGEDSTEGDNGTLTYHAETNTFTMPINEPEVEEMLGITELTFHQTRGGKK